MGFENLDTNVNFPFDFLKIVGQGQGGPKFQMCMVPIKQLHL